VADFIASLNDDVAVTIITDGSSTTHSVTIRRPCQLSTNVVVNGLTGTGAGTYQFWRDQLQSDGSFLAKKLTEALTAPAATKVGRLGVDANDNSWTTVLFADGDVLRLELSDASILALFHVTMLPPGFQPV
jgi:hypothetical protein